MTPPQIPIEASDYLQCVAAGHMQVVDDLTTYRLHIRGRPGWTRCPRCGLAFPATDPAVDTGDEERGPWTPDPWRGWSP